MSSLNPIGLSASALSNVTAAFSGAGPASANGSQNALSISQLQQALRQQLDQAFKQGSSLTDTGAALADKVSTTLQQYGVSDDQRQAVVSRLKDVFAQAGNRSQARQGAQQLLDSFVQNLSESSTAGQATAGSPDAGQNIDFTA